ncbi:MAG: OmpH family outer membrane protein [Phycisphaerae bacterium]
MTRLNHVKLLAILALLLAVGFPASASAQTRVAVADPARIFREVQERKDREEALEVRRREFQDTLAQQQQKVQQLQATRDLVTRDSPEWQRRNEEVIRGTVELQATRIAAEQTLVRSRKQQFISLYEKIQQTTAEVAREKQIDVVISRMNPPLPEGEQLDQIEVQQLDMLLAARNILYAADAVDISAEVIARMDQKYKSGQ